MEWPHTAHIFGTNFDSLKKLEQQTTRDLKEAVEVAKVEKFLNSLSERISNSNARGSLSSSDEYFDTGAGTKTGWMAKLKGALHAKKRTDFRPRAHEIRGTSWFEILHTRVNSYYSPFWLDYLDLYETLLPAQRAFLNMHPPPDGCPKSNRSFKEEINTYFAASHPQIDPSFTGTKLRALKRLMPKVVKYVPVETATAAWVYFERLALLGMVTKENRRILFGATLVLSAKFNEDDSSNAAECIADIFSRDVQARSIIEQEFVVFSTLGFDLTVMPPDFVHHCLSIKNIVADQGYSAAEVLVDRK